MLEKEKLYLHAFIQIPGLGPRKLALLKKYFGAFADAWHCRNYTEFSRAQLDNKTIANIFAVRDHLDPEKLYAVLAKENINTSSLDETGYPSLLKKIYDPPPLLYYRGQLPPADSIALAIVGTRKNTDYGERVLKEIIPTLVEARITIVSGLALGIDSLAHQATLDAGGTTSAVLGASVAKNEIYPQANSRLAEKIAVTGALISEYPPDTTPKKHHFPRRNRLISGLCAGTLVIEAGERSGALITAFLALEQNREVMAIPGPITAPQSAGCNLLISKGAALISRPEDVFECLSLPSPNSDSKTPKKQPDNALERKIYEALTAGPALLDKIAFLTKFDVNVISSTLSIMELKGLVRHVNGGRYIKL
jgi:DNA processing protein